MNSKEITKFCRFLFSQMSADQQFPRVFTFAIFQKLIRIVLVTLQHIIGLTFV